jgi:predicted Zn-dependent protease
MNPGPPTPKYRPRRSRRIAALLCATLLLDPGGWPTAHAQSPNALPALGDSASEDLSVGAEHLIGEQIMREIRRDPDYLDDPMLLEYLQSIWQPLLAAARVRGEIGVELDTRYPFEPFLVRERSINAFALPGGFIGVHLGLIAMTASRDELASVLAHELSHITQRHIARSIAPSRQASILGIVTTILGVLAASRSRGPDGANAANAVIAGGQAAAIQSQLNYSRDVEREADRVGYGVMTQAGFSPTAMAEMFEKLDQGSRLNDSGNYPYLRTHPLTVERIGEARSRAGLGAVSVPAANPLEHATARARARVLMDPRNDALRRLEGPDGNAQQLPAAPSVVERRGDSQRERLPDVLVEAVGGGVADRLGVAYASALAATLLLDWARADAALAQAFSLVQGSPRRDDRALRAVQLLAAQSMLERGDTVRAAAAMAPLRDDASRPVLILQAQIALAAYARAFAPANPQAAEQGPLAVPALKRSAESLQTWVATHSQDALAWKTLSQVWARLGQPLRALRADAEAQLDSGDLPGAIERLRAAQRLVRSGGSTDFIEASVVDARLRAIEAQRRELLAADGKKKRGDKDDGEPQ